MVAAALPNLIGELDVAAKVGSPERGDQTLRQLTNLLLSNVDRLGESQISALDVVLVRLIERTEAASLAQLSEGLSKIEQAPRETIRKLAFHNDPLVAAPVLRNSNRLSGKDLIEIASTLSQQHLLAISERKTLDEALTDMLMRRGDRNVSNALAHNPGAVFSECGYATLVGRAERDESSHGKARPAIGPSREFAAGASGDGYRRGSSAIFDGAPACPAGKTVCRSERCKAPTKQDRLYASAKPGGCAQSRRQAQRSSGEPVCGEGGIHQRAGGALIHDRSKDRGNRAFDRERPALRANRSVPGRQAGLVNNKDDRLQSARLPAGHSAGA